MNLLKEYSKSSTCNEQKDQSTAKMKKWMSALRFVGSRLLRFALNNKPDRSEHDANSLLASKADGSQGVPLGQGFRKR